MAVDERSPSAAHESDRRDLRAVLDGDPEAYAPVVGRHLPRLHALLRRFFRDPNDVDDLAQAALVRAFEQLERFDLDRPFYPWLRRIAVNLALHELARRKRRGEQGDAELSLEHAPAPERSDAPVEEAELVRSTNEALDRMPERWAAVFRLRCFEQLSYAEIAETLEIPIGTVMSSLSRARRRLAEALHERYGPHPEAES